MSEVAARQMFFRQMLFRALGLTAFGVLVCPQNNLWKGLNDDCAICGWDETDHFHLPRNFFRTFFKPSQVHSQVCYHGRQEDKVETREVTQVIILHVARATLLSFPPRIVADCFAPLCCRVAWSPPLAACEIYVTLGYE